MFHWLAALVVLVQLALPGSPRLTLQQEEPAIVNVQAEPEFGKKITFRATITAPEAVEEVLVLITPAGQPTVWETMTVGEDGQAAGEIDTRRVPLMPFSTVHYRVEARLSGGQKISSETGSFQYDDTRFTWKEQSSSLFQVHWYGEEAALGQEILNVADSGLERAQDLLSVELRGPVRIYAYTSASDLQAALQLAGQSWVAGHASPELGIILISVPSGPERNLELQRRVPHEIMHLLEYQAAGSQYSLQPAWLLEGLASLAELYPNPEYERVLEESVRQNDLLPMESLCASFPSEAGLAFRSYAQSESFVRFLRATFGADAMLRLMEVYQNGLGCKEGIAAAYGVSFNELEYRWKQEALGIDPGGLALRRLSPYLLLGLVILLPAALALWPFQPRRSPDAKN